MDRIKKWRELPLHLMILPCVMVVFVFSYLPMAGTYIAFQDFNPAMGLFKPQKWVGLQNFEYILNIPGSMKILWNTIYISFFKIAGMIIVPVTFALLLNEIGRQRLKRVAQSIVYLPHFLSWVILSGILLDVLSPSEGIINKLLGGIGIEPVFFLGDKTWFPITMVVTDIWRNFGFGTVVYLAALTSIDPTLYESAIVDGAGRMKQTIYITIPGIMPIIILMTVISIGGILNAGFDQIYNMYSPQVYETGDIIDTFVYRLGMEQAQYSAATAVGLFKSAVSFIFVSMSYLLADKLANYRVF